MEEAKKKKIMMKEILDSKRYCLPHSIDICVNTVLVIIKFLIVCCNVTNSSGIKLH